MLQPLVVYKSSCANSDSQVMTITISTVKSRKCHADSSLQEYFNAFASLASEGIRAVIESVITATKGPIVFRLFFSRQIKEFQQLQFEDI